MKGIVKWYNFKKGYGFIKGEDDKDYFIHYSSLPKGLVINENDEVIFDPVTTDKGEQAQNIKVEGSKASEESTQEQPEPVQEQEQSEPKEEVSDAELSEKLDSENF